MTQEEFIKRSKAINGDKYDYSKVVYRGVNKSIIIVEKSTGKERSILPKNLLYTYGEYKRLTKEEKANIFIKKSKEKFGDRFDYSKVEYVDSQTPVTLICKEHGEFSVNMYAHLYSKDGLCPLCRTPVVDKHNNNSNKVVNAYGRGGRKQLSTEYIVGRCRYIYGDKYDYSRVEYKGGGSKTEVVEIVCPAHGSFFKRLESVHKRDCGCPICAKERNKVESKINDANKFIENSRNKFGDRFDYSEVEYVDSQTPVTLTCKEHGIRFSTRPNVHLTSRFGGCKECYSRYMESLKVSRELKRIKSAKPRLTEEEKKERRKNHFIKKGENKFGDRFDYSKVEYVDQYTPVIIIDKESDNEIFYIKPCNFLSSVHGRPDTIDTRKKRFIEKARKLHGDKYDYSKVEYKGDKENVCIICPIHGEFWQLPHNHLNIDRNGCGCPKCSNTVSKLEGDVIDRLTEENIEFKKEYKDKDIFGNMRGDFFIRSYNTMIECQGIQHFQENNTLHRSYGGSLSKQIERDFNFSKCCKGANIKLFYYFNEDSTKGIDYLNDKKFNGIYTEENTFTNIDALMSCVKSGQYVC